MYELLLYLCVVGCILFLMISNWYLISLYQQSQQEKYRLMQSLDDCNRTKAYEFDKK